MYFEYCFCIRLIFCQAMPYMLAVQKTLKCSVDFLKLLGNVTLSIYFVPCLTVFVCVFKSTSIHHSRNSIEF